MSDEVTVADVIQRARGFLEHGYCKGWWGQNAVGKCVQPEVPEAIAWCPMGAIDAACHAMQAPPNVWGAARRLVQSLVPGDRGVYAWNDAPERTQEEVLELFRQAEEAAREG